MRHVATPYSSFLDLTNPSNGGRPGSRHIIPRDVLLQRMQEEDDASGPPYGDIRIVQPSTQRVEIIDVGGVLSGISAAGYSFGLPGIFNFNGVLYNVSTGEHNSGHLSA